MSAAHSLGTLLSMPASLLSVRPSVMFSLLDDDHFCERINTNTHRSSRPKQQQMLLLLRATQWAVKRNDSCFMALLNELIEQECVCVSISVVRTQPRAAHQHSLIGRSSSRHST